MLKKKRLPKIIVILGPTASGKSSLAVLMSMIYIYGVPTEAIQNIVSRYTSKFNSKKENRKIKFFMFKSLKKGLIAASLIFAGLVPFSFFLSNFLNVNFWLIFIANISIFFSFSAPVTRGVLQGRKKFGKFGGSLIVESVLKLSFAIFLVFFGMRVFGAIIGVLLGVFIGVLFSFYFNKDVLKEHQKKVKFDNIYSNGVPYFVAMIVILIALSMDIILAKRFFSPELAGQYSVLSMIGKMIFFGTLAISKAMFPLTSEKYDKKEDSIGLFKKSMTITILICIISSSSRS